MESYNREEKQMISVLPENFLKINLQLGLYPLCKTGQEQKVKSLYHEN